MQAVKCDFPGGVVGIIAADQARFSRFTICLVKLLVPGGSSWNYVCGNGFASNRNQIIRQAYKDSPNFQWIWFMDDDQSFEPDIIMRLLSRNVDIIQPIVSTRKPPYRPYAYKWNDQEKAHESYQWSDLPTEGIMEVDGLGCGGMLIKRQVLDALEFPWFEEFRTFSDAIGEDLWFCKKAKDAGFKCYVDLETKSGHMTFGEIWPAVDATGNWCVDMDLYHGVRMRLPRDYGEPLALEAR